MVGLTHKIINLVQARQYTCPDPVCPDGSSLVPQLPVPEALSFLPLVYFPQSLHYHLLWRGSVTVEQK